MGCCLSRRGSYNARQGKNTSDRQHIRHDKSQITTRGGATQQPSIEEAIDTNEKTKESIENAIGELEQQLEECR